MHQKNENNDIIGRIDTIILLLVCKNILQIFSLNKQYDTF